MIKAGLFDIEDSIARKMLAEGNSSGKSNQDVVKRRANGFDINKRPQKYVGLLTLEQTCLLKKHLSMKHPFVYVEEYVKPKREKVRRKRTS